jgi:serine/threonine-protein kinase RsbW
MKRRGARRGRADLLHDREQIDDVVREVLEALDELDYSDSSRFAVRLALEEAISNAFRHGHRDLPATEPIRLEWAATGEELEVTVEDRGPGFDPSAVPDPTLDQNLEMPSGRGLMLMRAYMSAIRFNRSGNRVTMVYRKPPSRE